MDSLILDRVSVEYIVRDKEAPSGVALILVAPDGENYIAVASGANARLSVEDIKRAAPAISSADILLLQLETPLDTVIEVVEIASAAGVPIILNPAPAQKLGDGILKRVTFITPNATEAELLTGITIIKKSELAKAADFLLAKGIRGILITLGPEGAYVATAEKKEAVPAFKVKTVDTTAAGDAFNGALAVALAEKKPLAEAVRFASAAAALSTTKPGAQPSIPFRKEIENFLALGKK